MKFTISEAKKFNKLIIYDFDDTLVKTGAKIRITRGDEFYELSTDEYADFEKKQGDVLDYDDFRQKGLISPELTSFFKEKFIEDMASDSDLVILTARSDNTQLVEFFYNVLPGLGYDFSKDELRRIHFVPIGDPTNKKKAEVEKRKWIDSQIQNYGYDHVIFYDDSQKNIDAVDELKKKWSNIRIETVKIDV